jgi:hypothetical protein
MKFSFRTLATAMLLGLFVSSVGHAAGFVYYDSMPSLFGMKTISGPLENTVSFWMTGLFLLALCAVPLWTTINYLLADRRGELYPDYMGKTEPRREEEEEKPYRRAA